MSAEEPRTRQFDDARHDILLGTALKQYGADEAPQTTEREPYYNVVEARGKKVLALNLNRRGYRTSEEAVRANPDEPLWGMEWNLAKGTFHASLAFIKRDFDKSGDEVVNWGVGHPNVDQALKALEDNKFSDKQNKEAISDAVVLSVLCLANNEIKSSETVQLELGLKLAGQLTRDDVKTHPAAMALKDFTKAFIETARHTMVSEINSRASTATRSLV